MPFRGTDMQRDDATPIYMRLANAIRTQVRDGSLQIGEALPPERELGEMTRVSRVTSYRTTQLCTYWLFGRYGQSGLAV